jgi:hypothetical protein
MNALLSRHITTKPKTPKPTQNDKEIDTDRRRSDAEYREDRHGGGFNVRNCHPDRHDAGSRHCHGFDPRDEGRRGTPEWNPGHRLDCRMTYGSVCPGDVGPMVIVMKKRFPGSARSNASVRDTQRVDPGACMPAFGEQQALTEEGIATMVDDHRAL